MVSITKLLYLLALICLSLDFFHQSCLAADNKSKPEQQSKPAQSAKKPQEQKQSAAKPGNQTKNQTKLPANGVLPGTVITSTGIREGDRMPLEPQDPPLPSDPLDLEPVGVHTNVKKYLENNTEVEEQIVGYDQVHMEDKEPVRIDPNQVIDHSLEANYVPHFNEKKLQSRDNKEQYADFLKVNDRLEGIMKYSDEWQAAQSAIKKSYFSNIKDNEFDRFLIHGFIAVMTLFIIIVMLCLIKAKCCKKNRQQEKEMEELDREAYDDLKKEYMDRRRQKIADQRGHQNDSPTETSNNALPVKGNKEDMEMSSMKLK